MCSLIDTRVDVLCINGVGIGKVLIDITTKRYIIMLPVL